MTDSKKSAAGLTRIVSTVEVELGGLSSDGQASLRSSLAADSDNQIVKRVLREAATRDDDNHTKTWKEWTQSTTD